MGRKRLLNALKLRQDLMHHSLRLYSRNREVFLRYYIFLAKWTRIPLLGRLVRKIGNIYGSRWHNAYALTLEQAKEVIEASHKLSVGPCDCRKVFRNCTDPINVEIMVGWGTNIFTQERPHDYREISKQEAKEILELCHQKHLVHTLIKCRQDFYAICNCCSCCCVPMRLKNSYGIGKALLRSNQVVQLFKSSLR